MKANVHNLIFSSAVVCALILSACGQPAEIEKKFRPQDEPKAEATPKSAPVPRAETVKPPVQTSPPPATVTPLPPTPTSPRKPVAQRPAPAAPAQRINRQDRITVRAGEKVDILFVDDNSVSMVYEQKHMAEKFNNFIATLRGLDYQIAITTTDVSKNAPGADGRFLKFPNGTYILNSSMNEKTTQLNFAQTIQRPLREGNQFEQGIKAVYRSIERTFDDRSEEFQIHSQFFRPDSALAVVFISDADESAPKGKEFEIRNSADGLLALITKSWMDKKTIFHSIIVPPTDTKCLKGPFNNEAYGTRYAALSEKTGGVVGSVCAADYGKQLRFMGEKVQQAIYVWDLQCDGAQELSLVNENQEPVKIGMVVQGSKVRFSQSLPAGQYILNYSCAGRP